MAATSTLVFPALGQSALDYLRAAKARGETPLAAASVDDDKIASAFGGLLILPYVYEEKFAAEFIGLINEKKITHIYSPVASVYAFLEKFIRDKQLPVRLIGLSPIAQQMEIYRELRRHADAVIKFCKERNFAPAPTAAEIASILRQSSLIYGESSDAKLAAIIAIWKSAPKGDVVEIGSLMGKSLSVLLQLANRFDTGSVLSIDPLTPATSLQHDSPTVALGAMDREWDYEILREAVIINMLPIAAGKFNYLRLTSQDGFALYDKERKVKSEEFGETSYSGKIAVIHIDGNHDYAQVKLDCDLWLSRLAGGAWLILDDYEWAHGDGPKRAGDMLLAEKAARIKQSFVCGKALFIQFY